VVWAIVDVAWSPSAALCCVSLLVFLLTESRIIFVSRDFPKVELHIAYD
jgi:hypothetical protein